MEKLKRYLEDEKLSQNEFGDRIGVYQGTISRYVLGERFPEPEIILKIEEATNGRITPADWFAELSARADRAVARPDVEADVGREEVSHE